MTIHTAATIAFVSALALSAPSHAATYHQSAAFVCSGLNVCIAKLPKVPKGKRLLANFVSCAMQNAAVSAEVDVSFTAYGISPVLPGGIDGNTPKHYLTWVFPDATRVFATTSGAVPLVVPAGKRPEVHVVVANSGVMAGRCNVSGKLVKE
jgi:hypothetical protein